MGVESGATLLTARRDPRAKGRHLQACLSDEVEYRRSTGLERFELRNRALPETALHGVDLSTRLLGRHIPLPLMIAPMTGGDPRAHEINRRLARAAQRWGLPMGVGSQRVGIEDPDRARYFQVRAEAPSILLFANIGGAQLVKGWGLEQAMQAVEMIGADALFVHLNPMQEAVQGGDADFRGLAECLQALCRGLHDEGIPVFVREVGFGLGEGTCRRLRACGVDGIDCAGAGGTSWARVEAACARGERARALAMTFAEWGIPTAQSILNCRRASPTVPLIASGGLRSGLDLAKAIALGADLGAMARPFLVAAEAGDAALDALVEGVISELQVALFAAGAADLSALRGAVAPVAGGGPGSASA
ncbi:type 2 isopentenyl-diphosphate Delta-isomerase [Ectothiorhodospira mobilis]|uniref:type 2 isopentenyl-diphosphate Delta-isomerase n=1 Tax=Ectothiorhodospira mobilis TaxID=195064 RepID=UPI0019079D34|nr:type 2 isopentenyl-diphosphate Delta-isomerase [Ectothiorhodospira mobilis]MBK1693059.1 type 2 isopentenyl-diphosphate Delta-isomerase [Ectothiorhodospira mobilis]